MTKINFTDFAKYIIKKNNKARTTYVKGIKNRSNYEPNKDFYKKIRDTLKSTLKNNRPLTELNSLVEEVNPRKVKSYTMLTDCIQEFLHDKKYFWITPVRGTVNYSGLEIKVNPEIGLNIDGEIHFIKIYFKQKEINSEILRIMNKIMQDTYGKEYPNFNFTIWDIRRQNFHSVKTSDKISIPYDLDKEAISCIKDEKVE